MVSPRVRKWVQNVRTFTRSLRRISRVEKELGLRNMRTTISPHERVERMKKLERLQLVRGRSFSPRDEAHFQLRQHLHEQGIPSVYIDWHIDGHKPSVRLNDAVTTFIQQSMRTYHLVGVPHFKEELTFFDTVFNYPSPFNTRRPKPVGRISVFYDAPNREYLIKITWANEDAAEDYRHHLYSKNGTWNDRGEKKIWEMNGKISRDDEKTVRAAFVKEKMFPKMLEDHEKKFGKKG